MIDREALFQLIAKKEWDEISKIMFRHANLLGSDLIIEHALRLFEAEFFNETERLGARERLKAFEYPGLIIDLKKHAFSSAFVGRFVDEKLKLLKALKSDNLLSYAASNQDRVLAREILAEIDAKTPEVLADARREQVSIRATSNEEGRALTRNLFRSKQEQNFFEAVREAFPTYHPYPNVAISCVLDFDAISQRLGKVEREYFFRGIIDCVVFDTKDGYEPRFFIELDSIYHDGERARTNDAMKDKIFNAANVKLIRIRAHDQRETTVQRFKQLVIEVMRGL